jgi:hypothetical protein
MKRVAKKKERRVFTVSRRRSEVARLLERSAARDKDNRKMQKENPKKEHRHLDHNNLRKIIPSGSGWKLQSRFLLSKSVCCRASVSDASLFEVVGVSQKRSTAIRRSARRSAPRH